MALTTRGPPGVVSANSDEGTPNRTLYVRNLPDKVNKDELKRNLYMLFATYGVILDIVALKTMKMRGQAHIVFRDDHMSTQALKELQGFTFLGKEIKIAYAKTKSDTIAKLDGTFRVPTTELEGAQDTAQPTTQAVGFGAAPAKAVPVNAADAAKGQKRAREEEEAEDEEDDAEMEMDVSDEDSD